MTQKSNREELYRFLGWSLLAAALLVIVGFVLYGSTGRDDAHITYWPAYTLAHMGQIVNYNGEVVEQSSSLLHVLLLAFTHVVSGVDIVSLGRLTSIFFGAASLPLTYLFARRLHPKAGPPATLITAVCGSVVYWSFGGLETTLAAFCVLWLLLAFDTVLRSETASGLQWTNAAVATLALIAVRPEMPIAFWCIMAGTGVALIGMRTDSRLLRTFGVLALLSLVVFIAFFAVRYAVFGRLFPLSVYSKSGSLSPEVIRRGVRYVYESIRGPGALRFGITPFGVVLLAGAGALTTRAVRMARALPKLSKGTLPAVLGGSFCLAYASFVVLSGGDWMKAGRFIVPLVPVLSAFIGAEVYHLVRRVTIRRFACAGLIAVSFLSAVNVAASRSSGFPMWYRDQHRENLERLAEQVGPLDRFSWFEKYNRAHYRDLAATEKMIEIVGQLKSAKEGKLVVLSGHMGIVMYHLSKNFFGEIYIMDKHGLASDDLLSCDALKKTWHPWGNSTTIQEVISKIDTSANKCGIRKPDLVYNLSNEKLNFLAENGYSLLFQQKGKILPSSLFLDGEPSFGAGQLIYVEQSLYSELGSIRKDSVSLGQNGHQ